MSSNDKSAPLNLIYLCHEFPKITETFVYREIKELLDLGHRIRVYSIKKPPDVSRIEGAENLISITKYTPADLGGKFILAQFKWLFRKPITYISELLRVLFKDSPDTNIKSTARLGMFLRGALLASMINEERDCESIQVPGTGHELIAAHVVHVLTGKKYGFTLHAPLALYVGSPLLGIHARDASWIASISKDAREKLIEIAGENIREKVKIVHCGIEIEKFKPVERKKNGKIIGVGSLIERKGHADLIEVVEILAKKGLNVHLEIVGEGPQKNILESLISRLNLEDRVKLSGGRHPEYVRESLEDSEVFALACRIDANGARDGIPVAIMEAMAMGLPCVSTRVAGIPELMENEISGMLVERDNPRQLAAAIEKLITDRSLSEKIAEASRKKIEDEFTLSGQIRKLVELIESKTSTKL